jgi:hypothetical protein
VETQNKDAKWDEAYRLRTVTCEPEDDEEAKPGDNKTPAPAKAPQKTKRGCEEVVDPDEVKKAKDEAAKKKPLAKRDAAETQRSASVNANFGNSQDSRLGWSVGIGGLVGATIEENLTVGTALKPITTHRVGAYVFAKVYCPLPWWNWDGRPKIHLKSGRPLGRGYQPSFALIAGSNLSTSSAFNDLSVGASLGHIVGRIGVAGGYQWIGARAETATQRQHGWFTALEFSF